jgi:protein-S-isoprenylcysteine O-methyltransferase Ste14/rhodanese-related sulfurtransferase
VQRLEWIAEGRILAVTALCAALAVVGLAGLTTGFVGKELTGVETALVVLLAVPAGLLLVFSLFGLFTYFVFIPSVSHDGHIFSRVHAAHLIHPLITSLLVGLAALCIFTGSPAAWLAWTGLLAIYILQTALIYRRVRQEPLAGDVENGVRGAAFVLLNVMLGGELVTLAGGARPLPPWRLHELPPDTWVVDVRTKPEFHWNRLRSAENYPWGHGLMEAAEGIPRERPVLVTCLSGHRSPAVALIMKRLGFKTVYNLNWGILYLMLLKRGGKTEGPFSLTRAGRDPHRRGEDLTAITVGHVSLILTILVAVPVQSILIPTDVPLLQTIIGAVLGIAGLTVGALSFRTLGRNFRVYAAPRRSGTLVTTGVYSKVRHPMYTAVVTGLAGYILLFGSFYCIPLWLGCGILYLIKGIKEDRILARKFPEYEDYCHRTWRFLPYVH